MTVDRLGQTSGGPVYREKARKYIIYRTPLSDYRDQVLQERKEQLEQLKFDEKVKLLLALAEELTALAMAIVAPELRIGGIALEAILTGVNVGIKAAQAVYGGEKEYFDLEEEIADLMFESCEAVMPCWLQIATKKTMQGYYHYRVRDLKSPDPKDITVAADIDLDQIYRFRCMVDPKLPAQAEAFRKNQVEQFKQKFQKGNGR